MTTNSIAELEAELAAKDKRIAALENEAPDIIDGMMESLEWAIACEWDRKLGVAIVQSLQARIDTAVKKYENRAKSAWLVSARDLYLILTNDEPQGKGGG